MHVVMVAPECAPAAKAGGLGDVVSGLSRELEIRGNTVEVILPKYANMRYHDIDGLAPAYHDVPVPWYDGTVRCTVWSGNANGRKCFFIEPHPVAGFFARERMYGYPDDPERFAFFSKAAVEFLVRAGKRPDIVHCLTGRPGWCRCCSASSTRRTCRTRRSATASTISVTRAPPTIGRLDEQKGMHLVHHALFYALARGGQFVVIGDCHYHDGIKRYGTVPIVRATGGMIDTVFDRDYSRRPGAERNGYVFHHTDNQAIESARAPAGVGTAA